MPCYQKRTKPYSFLMIFNVSRNSAKSTKGAPDPPRDRQEVPKKARRPTKASLQGSPCTSQGAPRGPPMAARQHRSSPQTMQITRNTDGRKLMENEKTIIFPWKKHTF